MYWRCNKPCMQVSRASRTFWEPLGAKYFFVLLCVKDRNSPTMPQDLRMEYTGDCPVCRSVVGPTTWKTQCEWYCSLEHMWHNYIDHHFIRSKVNYMFMVNTSRPKLNKQTFAIKVESPDKLISLLQHMMAAVMAFAPHASIQWFTHNTDSGCSHWFLWFCGGWILPLVNIATVQYSSTREIGAQLGSHEKKKNHHV